MTQNNDNELENLEKELTGASLESIPEPFANPIPKQENRLGHISASLESLKVGRGENIIKAAINTNRRDEIQVGDYVRIPYYDPNSQERNVSEQMLASVESLSHITSLDDKRATNSNTYGVEQYVYIAELEPISIISLAEDWTDTDEPFESTFVSRPPLPTIKIDSVEQNEFLRCGLDIPKDGIYVGDMAVNGERIPDSDDPLEYYLFNPHEDSDESGEPAIFRHVLVAGSTGTGKTHTSKNILRQFSDTKKYEIDVPANDSSRKTIKKRTRELCIVIIDPEEEYAEMGEDSNNMERAKKLAQSRDGLNYGGIGDETDFKVYAPTTSDSNLNELNTSSTEVHEFGIPFNVVNNNTELVMPNDPQGPTRQAIGDIVNDFFRQFGNDGTYSEFVNWFEDPALKQQYIESKYSENIINAAGRRLIRAEYNYVFDKGSRSLTSKELTEDIFSPGQVSVITTGHLRGETENLVIQSLASHIVDNKISSDVDEKHTMIKGTPLVLALDEAHEYVDNPETTREKSIVNKFRRAARRGRKDLFGLYFISQNPEDIDGDVRNQMNTKIYLQLDRRVVESPDVYVPQEFAHQVPQFDKGQMVVTQPDVNPVELVGLDTCLTKHSN